MLDYEALVIPRDSDLPCPEGSASAGAETADPSALRPTTGRLGMTTTGRAGLQRGSWMTKPREGGSLGATTDDRGASG
jgi:hypothetical protein